jgi:hypothetical protein
MKGKSKQAEATTVTYNTSVGDARERDLALKAHSKSQRIEAKTTSLQKLHKRA